MHVVQHLKEHRCAPNRCVQAFPCLFILTNLMGSIIFVRGDITTLQLFWFIFPGSGNKSVLLGHNKSDIALVVGMHWLNCLFL